MRVLTFLNHQPCRCSEIDGGNWTRYSTCEVQLYATTLHMLRDLMLENNIQPL